MAFHDPESIMNRLIVAAAGFTGLAAAVFYSGIANAEHAVPIPPPAHDVPAAGHSATTVLAGGCFWGMEAVFEHVKGVKSVTSGYDGGKQSTASYADVSTEQTGHAESVRIVYDPQVVSYGTLLRV
jgi:peptide-methionine (S)-S-oxide reductase